MNPRLLIALAAVLGATLWLQRGEGTDADVGVGVELADRSASRRPDAPASDRAIGQARPAGASSPAVASSVTSQGAAQQLVQAVNAREARLHRDRALPPPRAMTSDAPSAWAPVLAPPPPVSRPTRQAEAAPVAPLFPHQWVGRFDDEDAAGRPRVRRAVISGPVSTWVVRDGDVIEGQWRVDQIQDRLMRLTYLPLQQSQTLAMK